MKLSLKKWVLIIIGYLSLSAGIIGIVVPILPTTPFLLLSAACFFHGSPRLYEWMIHNKLFGTPIRTWREYRAITVGTKIFAIVSIWVTLTISGIFFTDNIWVRAGLAIIGISVTVHLLLIKTLQKNDNFL